MMATFLAEIINLSQYVNKFELSQIPEEEIEYLDVLSKPVSTEDWDLLKSVPIEL